MANKIKTQLWYFSVRVRTIRTLKVILPICGIQKYKKLCCICKGFPLLGALRPRLCTVWAVKDLDKLGLFI